MDFEFDKITTDILYFPPKNDYKCYDWGIRKLIAWPVYAYKVIAPVPKERKINILQKTILGLSQVGYISSDKISEYIGINSELIDKVYEELYSLNLTDKDHNITERGKGLLKIENDDNVDIVTGYIFQDLFTDEYWDRFIINIGNKIGDKIVSEKTYNKSEQIDYDVRLIIKINKEKEYNENIKFIYPKISNKIKSPSMDDIRKITKTHKLLNSKLEHKNISEEQLDRIHNLYKNSYLLDEKPVEIYWLASWIYFPKEISHGSSWNVYDPFGLENDFNFKKRIFEVMKTNKSLERTILGFIGNITDDATENLASILEKQNKKLSFQIKEQCGALILNYDSLFASLIKLKRDENEVLAKDKGVTSGTLNSLANNIHLVIETLFTEIATRFSPKNKLKNFGLVKDDHSGNRECIESFLTNYKINDEEILQKYCRIPFGQIFQAANYNKGRICARLLANLFAANKNPSHPLFKIEKKEPLIFSKFIKIEMIRNASEHGSKKKNNKDVTNISTTDYLDLVDFTYRLISQLLTGIQYNISKNIVNREIRDELTRVDVMIETYSNLEVKKEFGSDIINYEPFYNEVVKMFSTYSTYEKSDFNKYEVNKIASCFTKVFEALFEILNEKHALYNFEEFELSDNKSLNALKYNKIAKDLKFNTGKDGLHESSTHIFLVKIKNNSTLNAKILYSLLAASKNNKHPFANLAKKYPEFFNYAVEIQQNIRQKIAHFYEGDKDDLSPEYIGEIYQQTLEITKCLFENLIQGD